MSDTTNHPCPFCNCDDTYVSRSGAIACANCQARGPWDNRAFAGEENEVAMWNIRMAHRQELRERDAQLATTRAALGEARRVLDGVMDWSPHPDPYDRLQTVARFNADMDAARAFLAKHGEKS